MIQHRPRLSEMEYEVIRRVKDMSTKEQEALLSKLNINPSDSNFPKILIFDTENAPAEGYFWGLYKQNIGIDAVSESNFLICWSAKWLLSDEMMSAKLTQEEVLAKDDKRICEELLVLFNEADIVVAHNADKHDVPLVNTRMLVNRLSPYSPIRVVDTLKVAKRQFKFLSNKMDFINRILGLNVKIQTGGMPFWVACMKGDEEKIAEMSVYCDNDVKVLEEMYLTIRGWIKNHPNIGVYTSLKGECCPNCGSTDIQWTDKHKYATNANLYPTGKCEHCGAWVRDRITELSKEQRDNLVISIAR